MAHEGNHHRGLLRRHNTERMWFLIDCRHAIVGTEPVNNVVLDALRQSPVVPLDWGLALKSAKSKPSTGAPIFFMSHPEAPNALLTGTPTGTPENYHHLGSPCVERFVIAE